MSRTVSHCGLMLPSPRPTNPYESLKEGGRATKKNTCFTFVFWGFLGFPGTKCENTWASFCASCRPMLKILFCVEGVSPIVHTLSECPGELKFENHPQKYTFNLPWLPDCLEASGNAVKPLPNITYGVAPQLC